MAAAAYLKLDPDAGIFGIALIVGVVLIVGALLLVGRALVFTAKTPSGTSLYELSFPKSPKSDRQGGG
jgi:hypothetical protein